MRAGLVAVFLALAGCTVAMGPPPTAPASVRGPVPVAPPSLPAAAAQDFAEVVQRIRPVSEQMCRERRPRANCDFLIVVDDRPGLPPNAFQTLDRNGRPVIGITLSLIADARNRDEIAFILGHEAGHHIAGHLPLVQQSASQGAMLGGLVAAMGGLDQQGVDTLQRLGATVGARRYSKEFELEADALGTVIAARAGFDPLRGAEFFNRIPDPGNQFLGSHPPNAERIQVVRATAAQLGLP